MTQNLQIAQVLNKADSEQGVNTARDSQVSQAIENFTPNSTGEQVVAQLNQMTSNDALSDAKKRVANTTTSAVTVAQRKALTGAISVISERIAKITPAAFPPLSQATVANSVPTKVADNAVQLAAIDHPDFRSFQ